MKKIFPVVLASCFVVACNGGGGASGSGDDPYPNPTTNPDATQRHLDLQPLKFEQYVEDSNGGMVQGIPNLKVGGHQFWYLKITNPNTESIAFIQTPEECDNGCDFMEYNGIKVRVRSSSLTERFESEQLFSKDGIKPPKPLDNVDEYINPATNRSVGQAGVGNALIESYPDRGFHVNGLNAKSAYVNKTGLPFCYEYNPNNGLADTDNVKPIALAPNQSCIVRYNAEFKGTNFSESDLLKFSFDYAYKVVGNGYDVNEDYTRYYGAYKYRYKNQVQAFYFSTNSKNVCNKQSGIVKQYKSNFIFKAVPDSYNNQTEEHVDIQTSCHDNGDGSPVLYVREQNLKLTNENISMYDYTWGTYLVSPLGSSTYDFSLGTQFFGDGYNLKGGSLQPVYNKNGDTWIWGEQYGKSMYGISMAYNSANNTLAAPVYNRLATDNRDPTQIKETSSSDNFGFGMIGSALALSDNGKYMYQDGFYRELHKVNGVYYTSESRLIAPFTKPLSTSGDTTIVSAYALGGNGKFYYSICYFDRHVKTELTNQEPNWCYVYRMNNDTNDLPSATLVSKFYLDPNSAMTKPVYGGDRGGLILTAVTADESKFAFAANLGLIYGENWSVACGVKNQTPNQYVDVPQQANLTRYGSPTWINGQLFSPYYSSMQNGSVVDWDFDSLVKFDMTSCSIDKNSYLVNVAQHLKTNNSYGILATGGNDGKGAVMRSAPLKLNTISNGYSGQ